jgi:sulfate-transporting ATPase
MDVLVQQAVLALGSGAIIALAGLGVVQIYRGSGVLNFAHGAFALTSAQLVAWGWYDRRWPWPLAVGAGVLVGAVLGLLTHLLVMRPLGQASQLVRIIATIGVMQVVQQGTLLAFGGEPRQVGSFLPQGAIEVAGINVARSSLVLLAVATALTVALVVTMNRTRFGLATRAVAHSELIARSLGRSPDVVAGASWALGGALGGLAGALIVPIGGVAIQSILLLPVPAFAAAVLGGFRSYVVTAVGAVAIAAAQAVFTYQAVARGWPPSLAPALPFLVVVLVLVWRSSSLPPRDHVAPRLPRLGRARPPWWVGLAALVVPLAALATSVELANALITTAVTAIIGLSLVVCTGLTGQISLAQYAIAGIGALAAARASDAWGWPFLACAVMGIGAAAVSGALIALPASRTRGPALAVVTLGLGLAVQQGILADIDITGGFNGATPVERAELLGLDLNAIEHPQRYAALCLATLAVLALAVSNLGRSAVGRRLIAVRDHERAAAASRVRVGPVKVYAFAVSSAVAGVGGVLLAFRYDTVAYSQFSFGASLQVVMFVLIGGIGFVLGPIVGALAVPSGIIDWAAGGVGELERWLLLASGLLLVVTLVKAPDGLVALVIRPRRRSASVGERASVPDAWASRPLLVESLRVRFGAVRAVDGVSFEVRPGHVTGLIGANGAGKTTIIDAVSGFVQTESGRVQLGADEVRQRSADARARLGIARCFQSIDLFRDLTVRENLLVASERPRGMHWLSCLAAPGSLDLPADVRWVVEHLELADLLERSPEELSHGHRRLVGVARSLAGRPAVLLLDEPAAGLNRAETERLGDVIRGLAEHGLGILLVEHDVDLVLRVSDHVVVVDQGRAIYAGPPEGVRDDEHVRRAYLGEIDGAHGAGRASLPGMVQA